MTKRRRPPELGYDPAGLVPNVPTLYVARNGLVWELRRDGVLLSTHPTRLKALDTAYELSGVSFCNILAEGTTGRLVLEMNQDPQWLAVARELDRARGLWPR